MRHIKIVLMGSGGVGKTSLAIQFVREFFEDRYEPTIEEVHKTTIEVDGQMCSLELLDTAGIEQFAQMRDDQIAEGHGFILVYSVTDKTTFDDARIIREEISKIKSESCPLILVGNKKDLSESREVDAKDGEDLASRWLHCTFMETSAKCREEVEEIFTTAARQIIKFEEMVIKHRRVSSKKQVEIIHQVDVNRPKQIDNSTNSETVCTATSSTVVHHPKGPGPIMRDV